MAFKHSRTKVIVPVVEMTPMIDIVFLLIIFFMVAAQFAQQARVDLELPMEQGEEVQELGVSVLTINLRSNGEILVENNEDVVSIVELNAMIRNVLMNKENSWQDISIRADKNASTGVLNEVLVLLNKHGLSATKIATEEP
ncbi:MAG: biopolymer transporter ExbD [Phycisphaerales bacterium]|jgi:biopolymer transport protein ExbD|nr:biopolymer transporter ExbD [Phycisphaerales bacterium]